MNEKVNVNTDENAPSESTVMNGILRGDVFPQNWDDFLADDVRVFFDELLYKTGMKKSEIIQTANIPRTYGYQLMEGRRRGKRDYYILIALAMKLDLRTTQRMLGVTQCGPLHSLVKRDAAIIFSINHGYTPNRTYEFMTELGMAPLDDGSAE